MERRFRCTACGKCCFGWLPLSVEDALTHAHRFPLAVVWTPVRQGSKAFDVTAGLGITITAPDRKRLAVRMVPTAYIPQSMPCPALSQDGLCGIQAEKPSRCRAMPFFPYKDEADQGDLLVPRPGWACDTSSEAPVVYRARTIVDREGYDVERRQLLAQAPILGAYGRHLLASVPALLHGLAKASLKPGGGHVAVSFATLLRRLDGVATSEIARRQLAVLAIYRDLVSDHPELADYRANYDDWAWEMERLAG